MPRVKRPKQTPAQRAVVVARYDANPARKKAKARAAQRRPRAKRCKTAAEREAYNTYMRAHYAKNKALITAQRNEREREEKIYLGIDPDVRKKRDYRVRTAFKFPASVSAEQLTDALCADEPRYLYRTDAGFTVHVGESVRGELVGCYYGPDYRHVLADLEALT